MLQEDCYSMEINQMVFIQSFQLTSDSCSPSNPFDFVAIISIVADEHNEQQSSDVVGCSNNT